MKEEEEEEDEGGGGGGGKNKRKDGEEKGKRKRVDRTFPKSSLCLSLSFFFLSREEATERTWRKGRRCLLLRNFVHFGGRFRGEGAVVIHEPEPLELCLRRLRRRLCGHLVSSSRPSGFCFCLRYSECRRSLSSSFFFLLSSFSSSFFFLLF